MAEERRCGQCGEELPADAPSGLCPECLLRVGLQSQSREPCSPGAEGVSPTTSYGPGTDRSLTVDEEGQLALTPGQLFGGYRIVRRLGSGGMGAVYEADHLESGRRVALKVLAHRLDSPEAKQRFLREGRLAASVNHPNSVYVFGTEEIAGVPVIVMELVPGGTLEERVLREGPLPVGEAVDVILQVIDGLEAAEAGGVLHRDVKAANCFVDRDGTVKVGDFGLSISTSLRSESNLTTGGTFLGTPAFASPEQLRGDELDVRSDIYAVGVTLYYLLTAQMPYQADNLVRLIATVLEQPPRSPAELRPGIPEGLVRAVLRCLHKQPAARFRTYDELRQALAPHGSAAPTPAALGLRLGAGIVDYSLFSPAAACLMWAWFGNFERMSDTDYYGSPGHNALMAIMAFLYVLYFAVPEGLWGASVGKAICGVRVVNAKRNAPGLPRALARATVYVLIPQTVGLTYAVLIGAGVAPKPSMWLLQVIAYSWFALLALMFSTARRRNGYAGLQDLVSNTRVVLKSVYRSRPVLPREHESPEETKATPMVGPYHVLRILDKADGAELLLGYDWRLLRKVWIRRLPDGTPSVTSDVRDLARPGRLRWLAGRRAPGECWDAYEAPSGSPLVHLLKQPQPWQSVRFWLVDVAEELAAGAKNRSLPHVLALDRVWITLEGRAKLLDFPTPDIDQQGPWREMHKLAGDDKASTGTFLNCVAIAALEGRPIEPGKTCQRSVTAPLPLHARPIVDELPRIKEPEEAAHRLKPLLNRTAAVSRGRRLGLLAVCVAPLIPLLGIMAFGMHLTQRWAVENPDAAIVYQCLLKMVELERADGAVDEAEEQQRRDLELYVASRYGETSFNPWGPSVRRSSYQSGDILTGKLREIAEQAAAAHPDPSPEELAEATARLQPFLDELPPGLPGFPMESGQMVLFVVMMAVSNLVIWLAVPSVICALLFRGGLLSYVFGIAVVTSDGTRASRLRTLWRSLVIWSPCVLLPVFLVLLMSIGLGAGWAIGLAIIPVIALVAWSLSLADRGIPDRISGTYPVPR